MEEKNKLEKIIDSLKQGSIGIGERAIIPAVSFAMGFGAGKLGEAINHKEVSAIPLIVDLFGGRIHPTPYLFYGVGVAINYLPEIYQALQNFGG